MLNSLIKHSYLVLPKSTYPRYSVFLHSSKTNRMSSLAGDIDTSSAKQSANLMTILEKNPKRYQRIQFLAKLFDIGGYELRIAGGAVRDILRGVEPKDIDFATTARPEQSLEILQKHENIMRIILTASGQRHGTVAVKFKETDIDLKKIKLDRSPDRPAEVPISKPEYDEESPYEITTLRCDVFTDGRHAEVEFISDWKKDAERRDLTINAMFLTLSDGKLVDFYGGESDLKNGVVRFVGDADLRIREDYLRILRFFRFWARYGRHKQPDAKTLAVIQKNLAGLDVISGERIWVEIKKIFTPIPCHEVMKLILSTELFQQISIVDKNLKDYDNFVDKVLNEVENVQKNVEDSLDQGLIDELSKTDKRIRDLLPIILFAPVIQTEKMCLEACKRLKFSNVERDSLLFIIQHRMTTPSLLDLKYQLAMAHGPERPILLSKTRALLIYKGEFAYIRDLDSWTVPVFPLNGHLVSQEMRKRRLPGNKTGGILSALKEAWAASNFTSTEEELKQKLEIKLEEIIESLDRK